MAQGAAPISFLAPGLGFAINIQDSATVDAERTWTTSFVAPRLLPCMHSAAGARPDGNRQSHQRGIRQSSAGDGQFGAQGNPEEWSKLSYHDYRHHYEPAGLF